MIYEDIFNKYFPVWGICSFRHFEGKLRECAAKRRVPQNAKSIVMALFPYSLDEKEYDTANISRYAVVPDYHTVVKDRLDDAARELRQAYPNDVFEPFVDNSPLPEVAAAVKAGVGVKGKNGLLINDRYGSWVFIGEIITTLEIEPSAGGQNECIRCMKCVKACPTGALSTDGFDKAKCLSPITQQKQPLTAEQEKLIKSAGCAWGCDICQKVCPMNSGRETTDIFEFINGAQPCARVEGELDDRAYMWRGVGVIKRNINLLEKKDL